MTVALLSPKFDRVVAYDETAKHIFELILLQINHFDLSKQCIKRAKIDAIFILIEHGMADVPMSQHPTQRASRSCDQAFAIALAQMSLKTTLLVCFLSETLLEDTTASLLNETTNWRPAAAFANGRRVKLVCSCFAGNPSRLPTRR